MINQEGQTLMASYNKAEKLNSQCIKSIQSSDKNQFIFCTNSLIKQNQIHYIDYNENQQRIVNSQIIDHDGILDAIYPSQNNELSFFLTYNIKLQDYKLKILSFESFNEKKYNSEKEISWDQQILYLNNYKDDNIIITDKDKICLYNYKTQQNTQIIKFNEKDLSKCQLNPHHPDLLAIAKRNEVITVDLRDNKISFRMKVHNQQILDLDFNLNKQNCLLTSGEDYTMKIWDLRKPCIPVKVVSELNNWPLNSRFNPFHDQLVLSSYDDGSISLHKIISTSSAYLVNSNDEVDGLLKTYDQYEDSVSDIAWSHNSAWIFASISYSGNLIINQVPQAEKYSILF